MSILSTLHKKILQTLFLQGGAQGSIILTASFWARNYSAEVYGQYVFGFQMAVLASTVMCLGAPVIMAIKWSLHREKDAFALKEIFGVLNKYLFVGVLISIALILMSALAISAPTEILAFSFVFSLLAAQLLFHYFAAIDRAPLGNAIQLSRALVVCLIVVALADRVDAMNLLQVSVALSFLVSAAFYLREAKRHGFSVSNNHGQAQYNLAFQSFISVLLVNVDLILVRFLLGSEETAIYSVALFLYTACSFGLYAINANTVAAISDGLRNSSHQVFQRKLTGYARIAAALSAIFISLIVVAAPLIILFFGEFYKRAYPIFFVMVIGQIANACCGSVALLLNVSGNNSVVTRTLAATLLLKCSLGVISLSYFGLIGLAIVTMCTTIGWNIVLVASVSRRLSLNPTAFARLGKGHQT